MPNGYYMKLGTKMPKRAKKRRGRPIIRNLTWTAIPVPKGSIAKLPRDIMDRVMRFLCRCSYRGHQTWWFNIGCPPSAQSPVDNVCDHCAGAWGLSLCQGCYMFGYADHCCCQGDHGCYCLAGTSIPRGIRGVRIMDVNNDPMIREIGLEWGWRHCQDYEFYWHTPKDWYGQDEVYKVFPLCSECWTQRKYYARKLGTLLQQQSECLWAAKCTKSRCTGCLESNGLRVSRIVIDIRNNTKRPQVVDDSGLYLMGESQRFNIKQAWADYCERYVPVHCELRKEVHRLMSLCDKCWAGAREFKYTVWDCIRGPTVNCWYAIERERMGEKGYQEVVDREREKHTQWCIESHKCQMEKERKERD